MPSCPKDNFIRGTIVNNEIIAQITDNKRFSFQKKHLGPGGIVKVYNVDNGQPEYLQKIDHHISLSEFIDKCNSMVCECRDEVNGKKKKCNCTNKLPL